MISINEHNHAARNSSDGMGYCYELYVLKTGNKISKGKFFGLFQTWVARQPGRYGLITGSEKIKEHFTKLFA